MVTRGLPLRFTGPSTTGITNFFQGALGAGGFASELIMASDGSAMTLRNDTALPWLWTRSTGLWANVAKQPNMGTAMINAGTPLDMVFAPSDPNRMYMVYFNPLPVQGSHAGAPVTRSYLWRSTDKGVTWTQNTSTAISSGNLSVGGDAMRYCGPRIAVDPKNADVVYIISSGGIVYVSYDGGVTVTNVTGLLPALLSAVVNGSAPSSAGNSFTVVSNPLVGIVANGYCAFDPTWPLALGTNAQDDVITGASGSTITVGNLQARDGSTGATSIGLGDTIYFGRCGAICVDGSSDTIANPGGSGVISKYVYVSWGTDTFGVWRTTNGGVSWAQMSGGPTHVGGKMKMSNDSVLAGGGFNTNILYVTNFEGSSVWRYVENPPTGSSLSSTTWIKITSGLSNTVDAVAIHPTVAGKVCAVNQGGGTFLSTDFGTNYTASNDPLGPTIVFVSGPPGTPPNGTDTPWLTSVPDISMADCEYDRGSGSMAEKLWMADGIGVVYTFPSLFTSGVAITGITKDATGAVVTLGTNDWPIGQCFLPTGVTGMTQANGLRFYITALPPTGGLTGGQVKTNVDSSGFSVYTGPSGTAALANILITQNETMDSLTLQKLIKAPSPNGRILICGLDRQVFSAPSETSYPTTYWPAAINNSTDVTYSKSDPTVVWACTNSALFRSIDSGQSPNANVNANGGWGMIASTTPSSAVLNPRPGANVQYTTDGGSNWTDCTFGAPVSGPSDGTAVGPFGGGNSFFMVCDDFGNYYYWDHNTARFWKSTNGGANFTLQSTTNFNPTGGGSWTDGSTFCCPVGVNGEVWFCPGNIGGYQFKYIGYYSNNSGASWTAMNQAGDLQNLYCLAFGKAKPGGTGYPAAYATGFLTDPTTTSIWRCDDPTNAARVWTELPNYKKVNLEGARYLTADTETYGTVYRATFSTGYVYGKIS